MGIFKSFGKMVTKTFDAGAELADAAKHTTGSVNQLAMAMEESAQVVSQNVVEDLKIDAQIDDARRQKRLVKAQAKTKKIMDQIAAMQLSEAQPVMVAA